jgi:hypothetical protein
MQLRIAYTSGRTVHGFLVRKSDGHFYNFTLTAFEAYNGANVADYDFPFAEVGATGQYTATLTLAGTHLVTVYDTAFGQPIAGPAELIIDAAGNEVQHKPILGVNFEAFMDTIFAGVAHESLGAGSGEETFLGITGKQRIVSTIEDGNRTNVDHDFT